MTREIKYGLNSVGNFRLLNFATGGYSCKCAVCGTEFFGDKRATMCLGCAIEIVEKIYQSVMQSSPNKVVDMAHTGDGLGASGCTCKGHPGIMTLPSPHKDLAVYLMDRIAKEKNDGHECGVVDEAILEWRSATNEKSPPGGMKKEP